MRLASMKSLYLSETYKRTFREVGGSPFSHPWAETSLQDKDTTRSDEKVTWKEGRAFWSPYSAPHLVWDAPNSFQKSMGDF